MVNNKIGGRVAVVRQEARLDVVALEARHGNKPRVVRCESYPLEGGIGPALTRLRQSGKLSGPCATLLAQGNYQFLAIEAPPLPESAPAAELREAVRWKVKDMVDFPVTAAAVDALRIPAQAGRPAQLLAAAASHATLRPLIEGFAHAKIALTQIGVPEIAQRNVAHLFETPDRALALLTFGERNGLLTLSCNGELYATRRIDVGAPELAQDKSLYERVVLDVQRSLDNFDRNFNHLSLQRLLVLPVAGADDFIPHLRENLYQPVEALVISDGLDIEAVPLLADPATLADALPAIGLALGLDDDVPGLNLFDPALLPQRDPWTTRNLGLGLAAVGLSCAAWGGWAHWRLAQTQSELNLLTPQLQAARSEVQQLGKQLQSHQPDAALTSELAAGQSRLQARTEVLALLRKGMSPDSGNPAEWLRALARQVPPGLWLTGFGVRVNARDADSGALEIRGRTVDPALIAEYVKRLNAEPAFQGRTFAALDIQQPRDGANGVMNTAAQAPAAASSGMASGAPALGTPARPAQAGAAGAAAAAPATQAATAPARYHEFVLTSTPTAANGAVPASGLQP